MLRFLCTFTFFIAASLFAQNCTTYAVVAPFDGKTNRGIDDLKAANFEARAGGHPLSIVSATQNLNNRVLVLLQLSNSAEKQEMQNEARKNRRSRSLCPGRTRDCVWRLRGKGSYQQRLFYRSTKAGCCN